MNPQRVRLRAVAQASAYQSVAIASAGNSSKKERRKTVAVPGVTSCSREIAEELWRAGLLAALFNLPFDAVGKRLFDECSDFCIETELPWDKISAESSGASVAPCGVSRGGRGAPRGKQQPRHSGARDLQTESSASSTEQRRPPLSSDAERIILSLKQVTLPVCVQCAELQTQLADANAAILELRDEVEAAKKAALDAQKEVQRSQTMLKIAKGRTDGAVRARRQSEMSATELSDEVSRLRDLTDNLTADAHYLRDENCRLRNELRERDTALRLIGRQPPQHPFSDVAVDREQRDASSISLSQLHVADSTWVRSAPLSSVDFREEAAAVDNLFFLRPPDQTDIINQRLLSAAVDQGLPHALARTESISSSNDDDSWD